MVAPGLPEATQATARPVVAVAPARRPAGTSGVLALGQTGPPLVAPPVTSDGLFLEVGLAGAFHVASDGTLAGARPAAVRLGEAGARLLVVVGGVEPTRPNVVRPPAPVGDGLLVPPRPFVLAVGVAACTAAPSPQGEVVVTAKVTIACPVVRPGAVRLGDAVLATQTVPP